jgi:hypothetical protein
MKIGEIGSDWFHCFSKLVGEFDFFKFEIKHSKKLELISDFWSK